jgi:hypothetical protein
MAGATDARPNPAATKILRRTSVALIGILLIIRRGAAESIAKMASEEE